MARRLGSPERHRELLRRAILTAGMRIAESYHHADAREVDFLGLIHRQLAAMDETFRPEDAIRVAQAVFEMEERVCTMPDYVPDTFARLRASGYVLGAVSNSPVPGSFLRSLLRRRGLLSSLEVVISSADFGLRKPDPSIFAAAARRLDVEPSRVVYVGDRVKEDIRGPHWAGMRAVLTREHRSDEPHSTEPDAVVASLRELPAVIERL